MQKERRRRTKEADPSEVKTGREPLLTALQQLKPALRSGGAIPELAHLWLADSTASAYDGGLGIRVPLDLGISAGVPGSPLLGLLRTSSLEDVTLAPDDGALAVRLGRSRSQLVTLDPSRNPWPFPACTGGPAAELSANFMEAVRSVLVVRASPATRTEHHGVLVYQTDGGLEVMSTDSHTIARASIEEDYAGLRDVTLLPRAFAEQMVAQCPGGADLYHAEDYLAALGDGVDLYSNVLDLSDVADLRGVISAKHQQHPPEVPMPAGLEPALDRADVMSGSSEAFVHASIEGEAMRLSGSFTYGDLDEVLDLETEHPAVELDLSVPLLRRALLTTDTFSATEGSAAFSGGGFFYLVASRG